jgi:DNA segregation ATPase FtsK/SpoIIIE-like protein
LRVQAPFVSTEEIDKIVEYIKGKYMKGITEEEIYNPEIMNILNSK